MKRLLFPILFLVSCQATETDSIFKEKCQKVVMEFYAHIQNNNYEMAINNLTPKALEITPRAQWLDVVQSPQKQAGKLKGIRIVEGKVKQKINGSNGEGDYAQFLVDVVYENANTRERVSLYRKSTKEVIQITGYMFHPEADKVVLDL